MRPFSKSAHSGQPSPKHIRVGDYLQYTRLQIESEADRRKILRILTGVVFICTNDEAIMQQAAGKTENEEIQMNLPIGSCTSTSRPMLLQCCDEGSAMSGWQGRKTPTGNKA